MALHGRDAELAVVAGALDAALDGAWRPVVVVGEPGIGKSALLAAAAPAAAERDVAVLRGRAVADERDVPFALAAAVLDDHAGAARAETIEALGAELAAVLPSAPHAAGGAREAVGAAERFRYHRALRALVDDLADGRPFALLLDDLHAADDPSLEWVLHLLRRPPRAPGVLVATARPGDVALRLLDAAREDGEHVALGPLDDEAAHAMLDGVPDRDAAARLVAEAAGNPLFLHELGRAAADPRRGVPATIVAAVQQEAAALPAGARELLTGAAVAGERFDRDLAARAAGMGEEDAVGALDALVAADLVRPGDDGRTFRFRHPVVCRAVYDAVPPAARLAAHRRAAAELARLGAPAALRAHHVERSATAGDDADADVLAAAAREVAATAPALAARWYGVTLGLLGPGSADRRGPLLVARAQALAAAGRPEEALAVFDEAQGTPAAVSAAAPAARVEQVLGRNAAARARLERALPDAGPGDRAELELELGATAYALGDVAATVAHARAAAAAQPGDPALRAIVGGLEAFAAQWSGGGDASALDEAERAALALPEASALEAARWVGLMAFSSERFAQSARLLARALAAAEGRREDHLPQLRATLALALFFDLRPAEALEHADAAEEGARLQGIPVQIGWALAARAVTLDVMGRTPEAEGSASDAIAMLAHAESSLVTRTSAALSIGVLHAHDPERLLGELPGQLGPDLEQVVRATSLLRTIVRAALDAGRREDAERWVARAEPMTERYAVPATRVRLATARAELLLAGGDAGAAHERAAAAVALADGAGLRLDAARARVVAGRAAAAAGDRAQGVTALERALADASRGGAAGLAAEAARELRGLGARVTAGALRASGGRDELSERERAIAELVAHGKSNKEVAATLYLSAKTVENNLSRIYAKLGVRTRTELARILPPAE
jgi:DNA-binding CsgD family transcriptional regulator